MVSMLRRFLEMKSCVANALEELGCEDMLPSKEELELISEVTDALEVVEVSVLALGRRDCNLVKADQILEFLLKNLNEQQGKVSKDLYETIFERIIERRCQDVILPRSSKSDLAKKARDIHVHIFPSEELSLSENDTYNENEVEEPPKKLSKSEELDLVLAMSERKSERVERGLASSNSDVLKCLKREIAVLEHTGDRPNNLERIYKALLTIPPTSVEAERSFSAVGLFVTKLCTSLNDETINMLCFIRSCLSKK
jgi:hypothetical protein